MKFQLISSNRPARRLQAFLVLFAGALTIAPALALDVPWNTIPYSHYSDNEPLSDVISALMTSQNVPVVVSDNVDSKINLDFRAMQPEEFFSNLMSAHQLTWYYDGQMLYIYNQDEISTGSLRLQHISVSEFSDSLKDLGVLDKRFSWRKAKSDTLVYFSGPERFIALVMEMAEVLDVKTPGRVITRKRPEKPSVYRWEDESGIVRFSSSRPEAESNSIKRKAVNSSANPVRYEIRKPATTRKVADKKVLD